MDIQKQRKWPFLSIFQNTEYGKIVQNGGGLPYGTDRDARREF